MYILRSVDGHTETGADAGVARQVGVPKHVVGVPEWEECGSK